MEGKIALEEHFSAELNNKHWGAKGEEDRNGRAYAQDIERRLFDPERLHLQELEWLKLFADQNIPSLGK